VLTEGQEVVVKVLEVDQRGRVKLSMKEVTEEELASFEAAAE
jgi:polyribonucleotide nucleotidyltransferase